MEVAKTNDFMPFKDSLISHERIISWNCAQMPPKSRAHNNRRFSSLLAPVLQIHGRKRVNSKCVCLRGETIQDIFVHTQIFSIVLRPRKRWSCLQCIVHSSYVLPRGLSSCICAGSGMNAWWQDKAMC